MLGNKWNSFCVCFVYTCLEEYLHINQQDIAENLLTHNWLINANPLIFQDSMHFYV